MKIDIPNRSLSLIGVAGEEKSPEEMEKILEVRRAHWRPKASKVEPGRAGLVYPERGFAHAGRLYGTGTLALICFEWKGEHKYAADL